MRKQEFGNWSKTKRESAGLSQLQVKMMTGRNAKDVERGKVGASFEVCRDLGMVYGLPRKEWLEVWLRYILPLKGVDVRPAADELAEALRNHPEG